MRLTILLILLSSTIGLGQKSLTASRTSIPIEIDGIIDESIWEVAIVATDFTTLEPVPGQKPDQKTEVKVVYDDEAFYISAIMHEVSRDSIQTQLTQRDNVGNTDAFALLLDTYGNGTDGVLFLVAATGVQYDALKSNEGNEDSDWDAVWESAVQLSDKGWTCEMKIPYAAIRFPKAEEQIWTVNFLRTQRRLNLVSTWSAIDPNLDGLFTQSGQLNGIKDIKPPYRLSVTPYLSTYAVRFHDDNSDPINSTGYSYNAGMDIKYGINDAFTLDMTLVPDFGQVEADDLVVNLSPFEVQLSEKRPFFTEGLELFSKADLFYTRRIGGTAFNYDSVYNKTTNAEAVINNPQIPQLYNATKISGRTKGGLGIGIFNAVENSTDALIENFVDGSTRTFRTQPLTNYSVIVLDQNLRANSSISFINTNVWRKGAEFYDANVTGTEFSLKDKQQRYNFYGSGAVSVQSFNDQPNNTGYKFAWDLDKISGKWRYGLNYEEISKNYNQNDLGFQRETNTREMGASLSYVQNEPFWKLNSLDLWVGFDNSYLIDPNIYTGTWTNFGFSLQTNKFWFLNMWFNYSTDHKDYFEPRTEDFSRYVVRPAFKSMGFYLSTNSNKRFSYWWNGNIYNIDEEGRWGYSFAMGPRIQFSDKFSMSLNPSYNVQYDDTGWLDNGANGEIYLGQRDNYRVNNVWNIDYTLNNKMGFNFRARHNWTKIVYNTFHELSEDGSIPTTTKYEENLDFTFDFFSIDCGFNWRFAPGSDIVLVWKNNISGAVIDTGIDFRERSYFDGLGGLNDFPNQNSLSLRITYYLDQTNFRKWF
jgi:hypothetical protein